MKRRKFLKYLGFGGAALATTTLLLPDTKAEKIPKDISADDYWISQMENNPVYKWNRKHPGHDRLVKAMKNHYAQYPLTPEQAFKSKTVY